MGCACATGVRAEARGAGGGATTAMSSHNARNPMASAATPYRSSLRVDKVVRLRGECGLPNVVSTE